MLTVLINSLSLAGERRRERKKEGSRDKTKRIAAVTGSCLVALRSIFFIGGHTLSSQGERAHMYMQCCISVVNDLSTVVEDQSGQMRTR